VWEAPSVKPGEQFLYFDPMHSLSPKAQKLWQDENMRKDMIQWALEKNYYPF